MPYGQVNADVIGTSVAGSNLGAGNASLMKSRIINGDMRIDQRNAGASITQDATGTQYCLDRWTIYGTVASKFTVQQNAGSVTPPAGYTNYLGATSSSAYSVVAASIFQLAQFIEGLNVADLGWGTANAKTVTLSFWVRSSLTGTFGGSLVNSAVTRSYPFTYSIPTANTWTQISVTVAGDTSGTWLTTNGVGIRVYFGLGVGTTSSGTAGSWASADYRSATGATSVVGTSGATFYITGVQLEVGSSATGFEYNDYGRQFIQCQRYYQTTNNFTGVAISTSAINGTVTGSTAMRTTPTFNTSGVYSMSDYYLADATQSSSGIASVFNFNSITAAISMGNFSGNTIGRIYLSRLINANVITMSAEL